jgi:hypothetical protein
VARNTTGYEQDFYAWTVEQAKLLRNGELTQLDIANIAEEIESLGRRDRRELIDRIEKLLVDLLRWRLETGARSGNWRAEILQQRFEIDQVIEDSPSLRKFAAGRLDRAYAHARQRVIETLGLLQPDFPLNCPFSLDQVLAEDFLPGD